MWQAGLITLFVLIVFSLGKSPVFRVDRAGAAIIAAALMVDLGALTFQQAVLSIDFKTIAILFFMMIVLANLRLAGFFELIGNYVLHKVSTEKHLLAAVIISSGALSALCINDIICLLLTPIVILICRKANCNPLPHLLGVATASNVGSAATLLGNPQNILIAGMSGMPFVTYSLTALPIALIGLIVIYLIISYVYRNDLRETLAIENGGEKHHFNYYLIIKSLAVLLLVIIGYIAGQDLAITSGLGAAVLLISRRIKPAKVYANIDFNLLIIFVGLFIVVGGLEKSGLMELLVRNTERFIDFQNKYVFAGLTIALSNVVSNVPAVMLLKFFLPATGAETWWKALAIFSTFAGNLTITGSVANLIVVELAKKKSIRIGFLDYLKVGLPITLVTTLIGLILLSFGS